MDIDNGRMDGFIRSQRLGETLACPTGKEPSCAEPDVMGWHDAREIPNYWLYAANFVLQDHLFEPTTSWSLPAHLFVVSAWSASCKVKADPESCSSEIENPPYRPDFQEALAPPNQRPLTTPDYAWTDLTYLLHAHNVTWAYYIEGGNEPDCEDDPMVCPPILQSARTPGIWNPLPWFDTVRDDNQLGNIQDLSSFLKAATDGSLPAVSWVTPNAADSEVPPASISRGQAYVTNLINTVMQGPA